MPLNVDKLNKEIQHDKRVLRPFKERRTAAVRDYCGSDYGENANQRPVYVNVMNQAADTYTQVLAANRPRVLITSPHRQLRWFARQFSRALNNHIKEIRIEEELRYCVLEAFFCIGIMKVYYGSDTHVKLEGVDKWVDPGRPYAEHLSLDNFGFDVRANSWRKVSYAYDEYYVNKEVLLGDPLFSKYRDEIDAANARSSGHSDSDYRASSIMYSDNDAPGGFEERVLLRDIWLPNRNTVVTQIVGGSTEDGGNQSKIIREADWEGPENGPYHKLTYSDTPDNIIGVSPAMNLKRLSDLINSLYRKQVNQARRSRDIPIYEGASEADAKRIAGAEDGRWTRVSSKDGIDVIKLGGVDASNQQFFEAAVTMFDRMSGNLSAIAGLGPQSGTVGQDQIIQEQSSKKMEKLQDRTVEFTTNILRDLGWLLWNDEVREVTTSYVIPGTDIQTTSEWTPEHREGKFILYNFEIEPLSMTVSSPSQRANGMLSYVQNVAVPLAEMFAQQGGQIDLRQLTEYYSELMNLPRLKECIVFSGQQGQGGQQGGEDKIEPPPGSANTVRTHVRQNVSTGGSPQSVSLQRQQALGKLATAQQQGNNQ